MFVVIIAAIKPPFTNTTGTCDVTGKLGAATCGGGGVCAHTSTMTSCVPCPAAAATSTTSAGSSKGRGFSCVSSPMPDGVGARARRRSRLEKGGRAVGLPAGLPHGQGEKRAADQLRWPTPPAAARESVCQDGTGHCSGVVARGAAGNRTNALVGDDIPGNRRAWPPGLLSAGVWWVVVLTRRTATDRQRAAGPATAEASPTSREGVYGGG